MNKEKLARQYYEDLIELQNSKVKLPKNLSEKVKKIDKERFIKEYPLSTLGVINYRTFWEICLDSGIVHNPFHCDYEDLNAFEKKLHNIISSLIYMPEDSHYTKDDIMILFKKYKFSS